MLTLMRSGSGEVVGAAPDRQGAAVRTSCLMFCLYFYSLPRSTGLSWELCLPHSSLEYRALNWVAGLFVFSGEEEPFDRKVAG